MTILVTGATGFLGSAVARQVLAAGHSVRLLVRGTSDRRNLTGLDAELVEGDLRERSSLAAAVKGCDGLFHVAADYRLWVRHPQTLYETNVDGTRNLMLAAADAGVSRIVYTSSVAALGLHADGTPADEESDVTFDNMIGHYKCSKFLAEEGVHRLVEKQGLPITIVNPATPVGPRDIRPTPTGRLVLDAANGNMPAYVDTGLCIAHVDDVARGHLLAYAKGQVGRRYILGGENLSLREILACIAEITGTQAPRIRLPRAPLYPLALLAQAWARVSGATQEPRLTVDGLRMSHKRMYFSSHRAEEELGYSFRPAEEALRDAVEWFQANGYCS